MATLVLGAAGTAIAGPVGGFVGAAIGGVIDNYLLMPALFPKPTLEGPRIDDRQIQLASEGSDSKWLIGGLTRVAGTVRWKSDLIEEKSTTKVGKGGGGQKATNYSYFVDVAVHICDTEDLPDGRVFDVSKIWAMSKLIYDDGVTPEYESIQFYYGDQIAADPLIEAYEGAGLVPSFKNSCYVVIKKLALSPYGNQLPSLTFLVQQDPSMHLSDAVDLIMNRWGYVDAEFDVTALTRCFDGMIISGAQSGGDVLEPLTMAYSLLVQEVNGQIVFKPRGEEDVFTVGDVVSKFEFDTGNEYENPRSVTVNYSSTDNDLQAGSVTSRKLQHGSNDALLLDLPLSFSAESAREIANRIVYAGAMEREKVTGALPPSLIHVQPGDILRTDTDDVYVSELTRGANYVVEISGVITTQEVYAQTGVSRDGSGSSASETPEEIDYVIFDAPAFTEDLLSVIGLYCIAASDPWKKAQVFKSTDGVTFAFGQDVFSQGVFGKVLSSPNVGPTGLWDEENEIIVEVFYGTLQSCSETECLNDTNRCVIQHPSGEWECIGFQNVSTTGLDTNQYRLSRLLRGLRGTEHLVDGHASGSSFVYLNTAIEFYDLGVSSINSDWDYKMVPNGTLVSNWDAEEVHAAGRTKKPFSPCDIEGSYDGSDNLTITWTRRSKQFIGLFNNAAISADENPLSYVLEFRLGEEESDPVRTVTASTESYTYSSTDMTTDGFSPSDPLNRVNVWIYQVSSEVGRGTPGKMTIER